MNLTVDVIIEGLRYIEVMMIYNFNVDCAGSCVGIILLIVYFYESFQVQLLGIFCKLSFTLAVTSSYQVHALNADAHLSATLRCYFRCN